MIFVDTSIWIRAFRSSRSFEASHLSELIDQDTAALTIVTRLEILTGTTPRNRDAVRLGLSGLPVFGTDHATWELVERWVGEATNAGERFGVADLLIASITRQHQAELWSADADFRRMAELGFVVLHTPRS